MLNEKNWAGNVTYSAARLHRPASVAEVQEIVRTTKKLRALGSRHSFNWIADSTDDLITLEKLNHVLSLDADKRTVTVEGGIKYGQLCAQIESAGLALHNLASLPHISVAGGSATATHGSGVNNGNLATAVSAMELVTADGQIIERSRAQNGDEFDGMVVGLGAVGIITKLTLDLVPSFQMRQDLYENLQLDILMQNFQAVVSAGYSVSLFTDWKQAAFNQVWLKRKITDGAPVEEMPIFFGATRATRRLHPIGALSSENCTEQMGIPGPWYDRLPHFKFEFTPSSGDELQTEYFVPQQNAAAAIQAIAQIRANVAPLLQISEIRTIAADNFWMSPCYQQPCTALHFTWVNNWDAVQELLPIVEAQLAPLNARPHWGKLFTMSPQRVQSLYPKLPAFRQLLEHYDPTGKFRNAFVNEFIFGAQ